MAQIEIDIDFKRYISHVQLVSDLSPAYSATVADNVYFKIDLNTYSFLYADLLLLVSSTILHLKGCGIRVNGTLVNLKRESEKVKYASRVNFFNLIGFPYHENFVRRPGSGRFTEIKKFNGIKTDRDFYLNLHQQILRILHLQALVSPEMLEMLDFCLSEVMDNALSYSARQNGWASAQFFPLRKEIRIIVCDTGVGIHHSLTQTPESEYKHFDEEQAVLRCIERGVTSGRGLGNGLFFTSEFIKANAGELMIYSGSHYLICNSSKTVVEAGSFWKGTFLFFKINTDVPVDHRDIMGENSTRADDFEWFMDQDFAVDETLW